MRDDKFTTTSGIVNLHPTKGTHWILYTNHYYFDSFGCPPPTKILNHINRCSYSEYQIQKDDSFCSMYYLYVLYLTQIIGFKNAVLNLYYQTFYHEEMKKIITYSAQFKIIQPVQNHPNRAKLAPHEIEKCQQCQQSSIPEKELSKQNQEFINNIHIRKWI